MARSCYRGYPISSTRGRPSQGAGRRSFGAAVPKERRHPLTIIHQLCIETAEDGINWFQLPIFFGAMLSGSYGMIDEDRDLECPDLRFSWLHQVIPQAMRVKSMPRRDLYEDLKVPNVHTTSQLYS